MQNEDKENELKSIGWRIEFHFRALHGHPFEVELIVGEISSLPGGSETNGLCWVIPTWVVDILKEKISILELNSFQKFFPIQFYDWIAWKFQ